MKNDEKRWKVLKSEYLVRRPWLTARRDWVKLPSGAENPEYYVLEYPDWVNVIARTAEGDFVFVRQYRHGLGKTCLEIVAGVIDPGDESPLAAARRELSEETGYEGGEWRELSTLSANCSAMTNLTHCFVATGVEQKSAPHPEATEDLEVLLLPAESVIELLRQDRVKQALMAAPLWRYLAEEGLLQPSPPLPALRKATPGR